MVGFCHWHFPTFIITDISPPWWDFVMVGMCRVTNIITSIITLKKSKKVWCSLNIALIIQHQLFAKSRRPEFELPWLLSSCPRCCSFLDLVPTQQQGIPLMCSCISGWLGRGSVQLFTYTYTAWTMPLQQKQLQQRHQQEEEHWAVLSSGKSLWLAVAKAEEGKMHYMRWQ